MRNNRLQILIWRGGTAELENTVSTLIFEAVKASLAEKNIDYNESLPGSGEFIRFSDWNKNPDSIVHLLRDVPKRQRINEAFIEAGAEAAAYDMMDKVESLVNYGVAGITVQGDGLKETLEDMDLPKKEFEEFLVQSVKRTLAANGIKNITLQYAYYGNDFFDLDTLEYLGYKKFEAEDFSGVNLDLPEKYSYSPP